MPPEDDDLALIDATPIDELTPDPVVLVAPPAAAPAASDPLAGAAWQNIVTLQETQNALIDSKLSGIAPALSEISSTLGSLQAAVTRVTSAVDKLEAEKEPPAGPDGTPPAGGIEAPAEPERKKGPRWRK